MKPMLACTISKEVPFPVYGSPKLDGIRAIVKDGKLLSRTLKEIPNKHIQNAYDWTKLEGLDGEIIVGSATDKNVMQATTSGAMSREGKPEWFYYGFDLWNHPGSFFERIGALSNWVTHFKSGEVDPIPNIQFLAQELIYDQDHLNKYEEAMISFGFEGVMLRLPESLYKFGRSTEKEFALVKVKRFSDAEATVISVNELMRNQNELLEDNLGYAKRSSEQAGLVPAGIMGSLRAVTDDGIEFDIGTGFTLDQRSKLWLSRESLIGTKVKYKFFDGGIKVAPRFPVFIGFRHSDDMEGK